MNELKGILSISRSMVCLGALVFILSAFSYVVDLQTAATGSKAFANAGDYAAGFGLACLFFGWPILHYAKKLKGKLGADNAPH